ncbi:MAG: EamA family transporter [Lentisphaeria bacterium]|nr:EamA family transporter [Lentisphaeria bacterium]
MTLTAFILLLLSVTFHASWNLIAKKSKMNVAYYTVICMTSACCWLHLQFWTPVNVLALPGKYYLLMFCSVMADLLYCCGLMRAYRTMEMSTAYPMMRSLPLLFTAAITGIFGLGKPLTLMSLLGMAVVFAGCLLMPLKSFSDFKIKNYINPSLLFVTIVALGTTGYTIFDSQAQAVMRSSLSGISKPIMALTYYSSRGIMLTSLLLTVILCWKTERENLKSLIRERNFTPVYAGGFATFAYALVLISMNYVTNVSFVQVFRQLGLLVGVAGGILILKERCSATKIAGSLLIVSGLVMTVL